MLRNIKAVSFAAAMIGAAALSVTTAVAQSPGSAPVAASPPQPQAFVASTCFGMLNSLVQTQNTAVAFSNTSFVTFAAANLNVPSGSRCIKVVFTAEASANASCYVRALDNGIPMNPDGQGTQTLVSGDNSPNAHAYEWVRRIGSGSHRIIIQRRVNGGTCVFDDWTFDLQVYN